MAYRAASAGVVIRMLRSIAAVEAMANESNDGNVKNQMKQDLQIIALR